MASNMTPSTPLQPPSTRDLRMDNHLLPFLAATEILICD